MAEITKELFEEWRLTCGVREIQKPYEQLVVEAHKNSRDIFAEMKAQGFKDFNSFSKSCSQYDLLCWPSQLGELGSGHVLYFHFLNYLGLVLLLVFILQIPALALYDTKYSIGVWHDIGGYSVFFDSRDSCRCIGRNDGIPPLTLPYDTAYGTKCAVWDEAPCAASSSSTLGKWCCMSWCFAGELCNTDEADVPYKSNRLYKNLVRSTSACDAENRPSKAQEQCLAKYTSTAPFAELGVQDANRFPNIPHSWLSPGNTGPSSVENAYVPVLYLVCVLIIIGITFVAYRQQILTDREVDGSTTLPNDFAILVRGMPTTATDEYGIKAFFEEHAIEGKNDTEIVKVVIGWDATEYRQNIRKIKELRKQMTTLEIADPQVAIIKRQIAAVLADLASAAPDRAARLTSSGIVVVVFRYQRDHQACLARWDSVWAKTLYRAPKDVSFLPAGNAMWFGEALPRFPMGDFEIARLEVERAANPGDILWEELGIDAWTRRKMFLRTNGWMFLLIAASFGITYGLNLAQDAAKTAKIREDAKSAKIGFQILSFLPAATVAILNGLLQYAGLKFGGEEYYDTWTQQEFSQAAKMTLLMITNTAGVLFIQNARPDQWYAVGGLINDIFMMLLLNSFLPPLMQFIDFGYLFKFRVRSRLTQERLDAMNEAIRLGTRPTATPEEAARLKTVKQEVEYFKRAWTPSAPKSARRYAKALTIFFSCLLYSPVLPWVALIGCLGLLLQYWVDKYMLLRWNSRPPRPASGYLCMLSTRVVHYFAPLLFTISWYVFLTPSWRDKEKVRAPFGIALAASLTSLIVPMHHFKRFMDYISRCGSRVSQDSMLDDATNDYYNAQYMWPKEMKYHKDHFLYKTLPEAINPEYLSPSVDFLALHEDVKKAYGDATAGAAEEVGADQVPVLKGGLRVVGVDSEELQPVVATLSPTTFGVALEVGDLHHIGGDGPTSPVPVQPATSPGTRHWEFALDNGGFKPFNDDCQAYIEQKYFEYKAGRRSYYNIRTAEMKVSVDFEKMTSRAENSHKMRTIRRVA